MKKWLKELSQSIWQGVVQIFKPNEDNYPQTGVQPYEDNYSQMGIQNNEG